jgi:hypothetical protein
MRVGSFKASGSSANIHFYGESPSSRHDYLWCEVLRDTLTRDGRDLVLRKLPVYHFTVYQHGVGEIASFKYEPKTKPNPQALRDRTVTRLVRAHLKEA